MKNYLPDCQCPACTEHRSSMWTPQTNEERKMFMDAARGLSWDYDRWYANESGLYGTFSSYEIAESLAMDGL